MESIEWTVELRFIVALALGLLVGLERESSKSKPKKVVLGTKNKMTHNYLMTNSKIFFDKYLFGYCNGLILSSR